MYRINPRKAEGYLRETGNLKRALRLERYEGMIEALLSEQEFMTDEYNEKRLPIIIEHYKKNIRRILETPEGKRVRTTYDYDFCDFCSKIVHDTEDEPMYCLDHDLWNKYFKYHRFICLKCLIRRFKQAASRPLLIKDFVIVPFYDKFESPQIKERIPNDKFKGFYEAWIGNIKRAKAAINR